MTALAELASAGLTTVSHDLISRLEGEVLQMPQAECPVRHYFAPGLYAREAFVPAGTCAVGKIHRHGLLNVVLGDVSVFSVGEGVMHIAGMETFESPAGVKRGVYAHADTWWTTFHPNPDDCRDLAVLESRLIASSFDVLEIAE